MEKLFQDLERLLEIERLIPELEISCREAEEEIEYEKSELNYAKIQLLSLESPDFFLRLIPARLENKKELAQAEVRTHTAALERAKRELEENRYSLSQLNEEYQSLLPRREEYHAGKGTFPQELESHLTCVSGIHTAGRVLSCLIQAKKHFRSNASDEDVFQGNRQLEFQAQAAQDAHHLRELLEQLPYPIQLRYSYLSWPEHYVMEPTSHYDQLDRLNMAQDLMRDIIRQLRERL